MIIDFTEEKLVWVIQEASKKILKYEGLLDYSSCSYLITEPAMTGIGAANFMVGDVVIKIEVSGRFNSLSVFRGFIRL